MKRSNRDPLYQQSGEIVVNSFGLINPKKSDHIKFDGQDRNRILGFEELELDKQYYRDKRLNKILDDEV
jgi:hypothetical protein